MNNDKLLVVAIGCSAGGLEACKALMRALPTGNICYILGQHLSPKHESLLKDILVPNNSLTVIEMSSELTLEPNHFYVPRPNTNIEIQNNRIVLSPPDDNDLAKPNVDKLFISLAQDQQSMACGIVLSGTGHDGAKGVMAIKDHGGLVFVQTPDSSQYDSMPRAAIDTHIVDMIDTPENIAYSLARLLQPSEADRLDDVDEGIDKVIKQIATVTGVDFSKYRNSSIQRRLLRRLQFLGIDTIDDYIEKLAADDQETWQLMQSIFVVVSEFYRDTETFIALEKTIFDWIENHNQNEEMRIWVPGCATGEEAYTIAMIMEDIITNKSLKIYYRIFATDLSHNALSIARVAEYEPDKTQNIPEQWKHKYFIQGNKKLTVKQFLREKIIFSVHNVLSDPPFSRIHLLSCRNLIIYFQENVQQSLFKTFAYSLEKNGLLLLGSAEVCNNKELFSLVEEKHKIYQKNPNSKKQLLIRGMSNKPTSDKKLFLKKKKDSFETAIYKNTLSLFCPPMVIIDATNEIIFQDGEYHLFIDAQTGIVEKDLFTKIKKEFRAEARALLFKSRQNGKLARGNEHSLTHNQKEISFALCVQPIVSEQSQWFAIYLDFNHQSQKNLIGNSESSSDLIKELDQELIETRENLQIVIEELESTNEQLQVYNEELQSSNEEYQSTNEELQTVNEELQSTNEELLTMNEEYETQSSLFQTINNDLINIQESIDLPLILINKEFRIKRFTSCCEKLLDLTKIKVDDLIFALEWHCDIQMLKPLLKSVRENKKPEKTEVIILNEYYDCQISPYMNSNDTFDGYTIIFYCTSDVKDSQRNLSNQENLAQKTLETIMEGVIRIDSDLNIQYANQLSSDLSGWNVNSMTNQPVSRVLRIYQKNEEYPLEKILQDSIDRNEPFRSFDTPLLLKTRRGKDLNVELGFSPVSTQQDNPQQQGGVIAFRDVTALHKQMNTLLWNSTHDSLTGLVNRKEMDKRIESAIVAARHSRVNSTLLYIDLDQFKVVNDTCGHEAGDLLLVQLAPLMSAMLRSRDTLARLGGDEFAVLLEKCPLFEAELIAAKLQKLISDYRFLWEDKVFQVTASIGMVEIHEERYQVSEILRQADTACFQAKESGRNNIEIYTENNNEIEEKRTQMHSVSDINHAIDNDQFSLYFQKIHSLNNNPHHWEVLIRMNKNDGNFMPPGAFLPAAERFGLITRIDIWVLRNVVRKIAQESKIDRSQFPQVNINMSGATLGSEEFLVTLKSLINEYKIRPETLCFELTETAAVSFYMKAKLYLEEISALGCKIALDDFGRGMSSLSYLRDMPLDIVKIDGSFIRGIENDPVNWTIVKSVKEVADILKLEVVAESVETEQQLKLLSEQGIDYVQGYFLDRPISFEEFSAVALMDPKNISAGR